MGVLTRIAAPPASGGSPPPRYQGYGQTEILPIAIMGRGSGSPRTCRARSRCRSLSCRAGMKTTTRSATRDSARLENVIAAHPTSSRSRSSKAKALVTEKELVELCSVRLGAASRSIAQDAVSNIKRTELREPFWVVRSAGSQATDGARGTLARMSQEVRAIHLLR
jgi:hypothetical protein